MQGDHLRQVMRRVPSPVTVVTLNSGGDYHGVTIGSFTSVSLVPPLISFNVQKDSTIHPLLMETDRFAVHVLHDAQAFLANHFAQSDFAGADPFADLDYAISPEGLPILEDTLAVLHCHRHAVYPAGDHDLILGEVYRTQHDEDAAPVLYFDRSYRGVGSPVQSMRLVPVKRASSS